MPKEVWLAQNGEQLPGVPKWEDVPSGMLPVCLMNNGPFTAAGIAYSQRELEEFSRADDPRPKVWFLCLTDDLHTVSPQLRSYMERAS